MNQSWSSKRAILDLARGALGLLSVGFALLSLPAFAQIVPDTTLGTESSRVNPNVNIRGLPGDRIDGGAVRGSSLFHSFSQFNVNNGQRVYFADPAGIANIFSRVTGSTPSNILGTLGVDGAANLFLLNPNGILFGPNALVDIQGSFVATTGDRFIFPNGAEFGASNPQSPPLLTMSVPVGVQYGAQPGNIVNTGNLKVGQDLTLAGGNLDLQGQLRAGRDLTLQAQNTVRARDSAINPFIASAGGKLVVQGNQAVDIVALRHPNSGLFSGGDMVLRSANTVGGDAHYWSGGNFRIEKLDGNLGNLFSPADPVIRASGDVSFANYTGASLHIFAGGSVTITGNVTITGTDVTNFINETVPLSQTLPGGTNTVTINGSTQPTLDIRAGTTAIGTPGISSTAGFTPAAPGTGGTGTSADIRIGNVDFSQPNGDLLPYRDTVFLTNRYSPNSLPSPNGITVGAINTVGTSNSGSVSIDSRTNITVNEGIDTYTIVRSGFAGNIKLLAAGDIVVNGILDTSADSQRNSSAPNNANDLVGFAGNVTLKAGGNIRLNSGSEILTYGQFAGLVVLESGADTFITGSLIDTKTSITSVSNSPNTLPEAIFIIARSLSIKDSKLTVESLESGDAGYIYISATDKILIDNSQLSSNVVSPNGGIGGYIRIAGAESIQISNNTKLTTSSKSQQNGPGEIFIQANDRVSISNSELNSNSNSTVAANFGNIKIEATNGSVFLDNSNVKAESTGGAFAGDIFIGASDRIEITNGSNISSDGDGGNISVGTKLTPQTVVIDNSKLSTNGKTNPDAGDISIDARDRIEITNNSNISADGNFGLILVGSNSTPQTVLIDHSNLTTTNKNGAADQQAGFILINASDSIEITNNSNISADGNFGLILVGSNLTPQTVVIDNSKLTTNGVNSGNLPSNISAPNQDLTRIVNASQENAGDIDINANRITLNNRAEISAKTNSGQAGNINIKVTDLLLLRNESNISTSAGTPTTPGNGGTIKIDVKDGFVIAVPSENSNIVANAFGGQGGEITINSNRVFGLKPETKVTTRDALNSIINNPPSQISAGSDVGVQGKIEINSLEVDPSQGLGELPIDVVDPSGLIATGCGPTGGKTANRQSQFVVTGRGGLPPGPNDLQTPRTTSPGWVTRDGGNVSRADIPDQAPTSASTDTLVEAQGMVKTANGELLLTAQSPTSTPHQSGLSTQLCVPTSDRR